MQQQLVDDVHAWLRGHGVRVATTAADIKDVLSGDPIQRMSLFIDTTDIAEAREYVFDVLDPLDAACIEVGLAVVEKARHMNGPEHDCLRIELLPGERRTTGASVHSCSSCA
jgi:hypothetical protein